MPKIVIYLYIHRFSRRHNGLSGLMRNMGISKVFIERELLKRQSLFFLQSNVI